MIRQPIITVMGHVDHGKTLLLDKIRGTAVAEKEAGAITQHIGATEVPLEVIKRISGELMKKYGFEVSLPGLLFIDTPGHEAFTNLRKRGGSIADLAILVIDIMQSCQPQTFEAIEILRSFKTPFVVAANKIDLIQEWESSQGSFSKNLEMQSEQGKKVLDEKIYKLVGELFEKGFQSERFDRCSDFTKYVPIVPVSAKTGEGLPEILMLLAGLSQKFLKERLIIHPEESGKGTILEVKEEKGLGTTIDVILYEGTIAVNDKIAVGSKTGVLETKVRALLKPKPLEEIRNPTERFQNVKEVSAAAGIKIVASNLADALAGSPIVVEAKGGEIKEVKEEINSIIIEGERIGPILKADALGSLEALVNLLEKEGLKAKKTDIGDVTKKDVMEAVSIKKKDPFKGVIFAFNVRVDSTAEIEAKKHGIKIFNEDVIYKLIEDYQQWLAEKKEEEKKEKLSRVVLPVQLKVLPNHVFRNSKPAIVGVKVVEGTLKAGVKLFRDNKIIGKVNAIQSKNESIKEALKNDEVAVSIDKGVVGRNFFENDTLYSFIPKNHFEKLEELTDILSKEEVELIRKIKEIEESIEEEDGE